ncbi:hypothetical protein BGZ61DRAFT_446452 [Ilyonectria robusta]|uniref:uncharacterized protein n=1 Tax=Ilyonectria robusta TaxID=1079257 RepID=UPI001E8E448C|nr:uncharacterized protein BGZ61DRAFT_446452 [Ilyonectria robusta]KAH8729477.1 hypothetical protein BGZ61DRAFT_446452 [Ilyonectria robusta]
MPRERTLVVLAPYFAFGVVANQGVFATRENWRFRDTAWQRGSATRWSLHLEWMCFFLLTFTLVSNFAISNQAPWCGTVPERPQTRLCRVVPDADTTIRTTDRRICGQGVLVAPSWVNGRLYPQRLGNRQKCTRHGRMQGSERDGLSPGSACVSESGVVIGTHRPYEETRAIRNAPW